MKRVFFSWRPASSDSILEIDHSCRYGQSRPPHIGKLVIILESRTPLSCSAWRISRRAFGKPGCSSAWTRSHQQCTHTFFVAPSIRTNLRSSSACRLISALASRVACIRLRRTATSILEYGISQGRGANLVAPNSASVRAQRSFTSSICS